MKLLIYGAGTIGLTYAYLLSKKYDVDILVKNDKMPKEVVIEIKELKKSDMYEKITFVPNYVRQINEKYDVVIVTVNRTQLKEVLPILKEKQAQVGYFSFMQNNWNIQWEVEQYISDNQYIIAFPSNVGGGRDNNIVRVILFDEPVRTGGINEKIINDFCKLLKDIQIKTCYDANIFDWLKIHYFQQSITAGAVLKNNSFVEFANNFSEVKEMVKAFREGIEVCKVQGYDTIRTFPAYFFKLPTFIVAYLIQKMFQKQNTIEMVNNHMKKGLKEWIAGYKEVLDDGLKSGLPMKNWKSYDYYIENYLKNNRLKLQYEIEHFSKLSCTSVKN